MCTIPHKASGAVSFSICENPPSFQLPGLWPWSSFAHSLSIREATVKLWAGGSLTARYPARLATTKLTADEIRPVISAIRQQSRACFSKPSHSEWQFINEERDITTCTHCNGDGYVMRKTTASGTYGETAARFSSECTQSTKLAGTCRS